MNAKRSVLFLLVMMLGVGFLAPSPGLARTCPIDCTYGIYVYLAPKVPEPLIIHSHRLDVPMYVDRICWEFKTGKRKTMPEYFQYFPYLPIGYYY